MAPAPRAVEVLDWQQAELSPRPGDVVLEAFGCHLPETFVAGACSAHNHRCGSTWNTSARKTMLNALTGLQSPVWNGAGAGLKKWFFYPGFTQRTGGLLREPGFWPAAMLSNKTLRHALTGCATWGVGPRL